MQDALIDAYAASLKARGLKSWRSYELAARRFLLWLSSKRLGLSDVSPAILHEYLCHRRTPTHGVRMVEDILGHLRPFFCHAVAQKLVADDPTQGVSCHWLDAPGGLPAYQGVLRRILRNPRDMLRLRLPLFAPHWEAFLERLVAEGHSRSDLSKVLAHNCRFHCYLAERGIRGLSEVTPDLLEDFLRHRQRVFHREHGYPIPKIYRSFIRSRLVRFLAFARVPVFRAARRDGDRPVAEGILGAYLGFCRDHSGLSPATISGYRRELGKLQRFLRRKGFRNLREVNVASLDAFLLLRSRFRSARSLASVATALRSFLRYLLLHGHIDRDLAAAVVRPSRFRDDLRPKYLPWHKIEELLAGMDRRTPLGKREYAIVSLLAGHGLRAREVAGLRVDDVDLEKRSLRLRQRKNGSTTDLPLSDRAALAIRDYLAVRLDAGRPELFLGLADPFRPLTASVVAAVAAKHLRRVRADRGGAYVLRHSFAKAMLDRGARLPEIGAMLGHRSLRSTLIYTRVATEDMREVAQNYAEWL